MIRVSVWVHREDADNWWVTAGGHGAPVNLPKRQVRMPHGFVVGPLGGPVDAKMPRWLAQHRGLVSRRDDRQGEML